MLGIKRIRLQLMLRQQWRGGQSHASGWTVSLCTQKGLLFRFMEFMK
jgi:hypothetical protein